MSQKKLFFLALFALGLVISCSKDDGPSTPPNTAPVIKAQTFNAAENISDATIIGTVTATDADKGDKLTFSIATNSGDLFEITNAGALSLATGKTLDFDTKKQHVLSVSVSDGKATAKADVTIKVTEVVAQNQPPVIEAQGFEAAEDIADTDVIGTVVASDPEQDALTFSISTNDDDIFEIDASSGELSLAEGKSLDFETAESHAITVGVTDGNSSATATITINVADIPEIQAQSFEAAEDIADTDVIGTIVVPNATFTISTNDNDLFEIDASSGELSLVEGKSLDFETAEEHSITVMAANGNGSTEATVTITVTNVIETLADDPASFITTWVTTANNETIVIGVDETLTYDYTIDWGDGTVEDIINSNDPQHEYAGPGTYTVAIKGTFPAIKMKNGNLAQADQDKLASIEQWGTNPWASMNNAFASCGNMAYNATDVPDLSQVTDMGYMFPHADAFNGDLSGWDVSNVTNMRFMFTNADIFEGTGLSGWDVSNVTDMGYMFSSAFAFNGDISGWITESVTDMNNMLNKAYAFNRDLGAWNIGSVTNMSSMLDNSGLSSENYSNTLTGWANYVLNNNELPAYINLGADGVNYCDGESGGRLYLAGQGWTISDAGPVNCN